MHVWVVFLVEARAAVSGRIESSIYVRHIFGRVSDEP